MLLQENTSTLTNITNSQAFRIDASDKAFKVLSNNMYSDKVQSIIRELSTNAYDSHVENGNETTPFDVHIPTYENPHFHIRDYGIGMSEEDVYEVYTTYFSSTKTHSNALVGAFGLGSKTPFSYTDSFQVVSWSGGVEYNYVASIINGTPSVSLLSKEYSDEPTGVKVKFAVNVNDLTEFEKKAKLVYRFFDTPPNINVEIETKDSMNLDKVGDGIYLSLDPDRSYKHSYYKTTKTYIVQGNIAYLLDSEYTYDLITWKNRNVDIFIEVPIGTVDMTVSREKLEMTDKTLKTVKDKVEEYNTSFFESMKKSEIPCYELKELFDNKQMLEIVITRYNPKHWYVDTHNCFIVKPIEDEVVINKRGVRVFRQIDNTDSTESLNLNTKNIIYVTSDDVIGALSTHMFKGAVRKSKADVIVCSEEQAEELALLRSQIYNISDTSYYTLNQFIETFNPKQRPYKNSSKDVDIDDFYFRRLNVHLGLSPRLTMSKEHITNNANAKFVVFTKDEFGNRDNREMFRDMLIYANCSSLGTPPSLLEVSKPNKKKLMSIHNVYSIEEFYLEAKEYMRANLPTLISLSKCSSYELNSLKSLYNDLRHPTSSHSNIKPKYLELLNSTTSYKMLKVLNNIISKYNNTYFISSYDFCGNYSKEVSNFISEYSYLQKIVKYVLLNTARYHNNVTVLNTLKKASKGMYTYGGSK